MHVPLLFSAGYVTNELATAAVSELAGMIIQTMTEYHEKDV